MSPIAADRAGPSTSSLPIAFDRRDPDNFSQRGAFSIIEEILRSYGLLSLGPKVRKWLEDGSSEEEIIQLMRQTDEFKQRFPAIVEREAAGLPPLSPGDYVNYEREARQILRSFGLPPGFFDSTEDFTELLTADVSISELQSRVEQGYHRVAQLNQEVREVFRDWFGVQGDNALAAFFLDPDRAMPVLERMVGTAEIGAESRRLHIGLDNAMARKLFGIGVDQAQARSGFQELDQERGLYDETLDEDQDLALSKEGVEAQFGLDSNSSEAIRRRRGARSARFEGGGGAATSGTGTSAGAAEGR